MSESEIQTVYDGGDPTRKQPTLTTRTDELLNSIADDSQTLSKGIVAYEMILLGNSEYKDVFTPTESVLFKSVESQFGSTIRKFFEKNQMVKPSRSRRMMSAECTADGDDTVSKISHCSLWIPTDLAEQLRGSRGLNDKIDAGLYVYLSDDSPYSDRLNRAEVVSELVSSESVDDVPLYIDSLINLDDDSLESQIGDIIESVLEGESPADLENDFEESEEDGKDDDDEPHWKSDSYDLTSLMLDNDLPQDKRRLEAFCEAYNHYLADVRGSEYYILTPHKIRNEIMELLEVSERTAYNYHSEMTSIKSDYKIVGNNVISLGVSDFKQMLNVVDRAVDDAGSNQMVVAPETITDYTSYDRAKPDAWESGEHLRIVKKVQKHNEQV